MSDITLEKVDAIRERTGVSYAEAKSALEACNGDIVDALVYLEGKEDSTTNSDSTLYTTKDEFVKWVKDVVRKGNVTRIKIKKEDKVIVDVPVNAGIAVTGIAYIIAAPLLALGVVSAVIAKVTVEITKEDGSVEVVNKIIKSTVNDVKDKLDDVTGDMNIKNKIDGFAGEFMDKFSNISEDVIQKVNNVTEEVKEKFMNKNKEDAFEGNVYKYTVKFEDVTDEKKDESKEQ